MVSREVIERAAQRLATEAGPGARVFLFGSHARGDAGPTSGVNALRIPSEASPAERKSRATRRRAKTGTTTA